MGRPALQQAIRESAGRCTDVERALAPSVDGKHFKRMFEFLSAPAHEAPRPIHLNHRIRRDVRTRLHRPRPVDFDASLHNERPRLRPRYILLRRNGLI